MCFSTEAQRWIGKFHLAETNQYYAFPNATFHVGDQKFKVDLSLIFVTTVVTIQLRLLLNGRLSNPYASI